MSTLFALPTELILRVLAEVEPLDLVRISRVCRAASNILADRAVWEDAVRHLHSKNSLFKPSFQPLHSLKLEELRRMAFRPNSLHVKLGKVVSGQLYPARERTLEYVIDEMSREDFIRVHIVPGGRYVIGLAFAYICLWDVGPPGTAPLPILADIFHSESQDVAFLSMSAPSQSSQASFRIAVLGDSGNGSSQRLQVFEVRPLDEGRMFQLLGTFRLGVDQHISRFWVSGDRLFLTRDNGTIVVWDFVSSSAVCWNLPRTPGVMPHCDVMNKGDTVVLLAKDKFYTCKLPAFQHMGPSSTFFASQFFAYPPITDASYPSTVIPQYFFPFPSEFASKDTLIIPSNWTSSDPDSPLVFDSLKGRTFHFSRFELRVGAPIDESECRVVASSAPGTFGLDPLLKIRRARFYSECGRDFYVMGNPSELGLSVAIHYSTFNDEGDPEWRTVEQCALEHHLDVSSLLCPYSGRFAYVCKTGHNHGFNMVHVVDLLEE